MKNQTNKKNTASIVTLQKLIKRSEGFLGKMVPTTMRQMLTPDRITKVVCVAARKVPKLLECTDESLMFCVTQACRLGLEPGGAMDHVYLIPRWNSKLGAQECTIIVSYKGIMELARRTGLFKNIEAHAVYENDHIEVVWGTETKVVHRPELKGERGSLIGAHCRADFVNGGMHHEYMTLDDINHVRASATTDNVWAAHTGEMARKSVVRRAAKYWPQAVELMEAMVIDGRASEEDDVIDVEAEEVSAAESEMDRAKRGVQEQAEALVDEAPPLEADDGPAA